MDERTRRYYDTHGPDLGATYAGIASPMRRYFAMTFAPGARVLDVDAGVGNPARAASRRTVPPSSSSAMLDFPVIGLPLADVHLRSEDLA